MAILRKTLPEVSPSSLSGVVSGQSVCWYAPWFKAHYAKYEKAPNNFDFAKWNVDHTALMQRTLKRMSDEGWTCTVENQNYFKLEGSTAILKGKADIVGRRKGVIKVVDCKSGRPYDKHTVQVVIYMLALPKVWGKALVMTGEVVYEDSNVLIDQDEANLLAPKIWDALKRIGAQGAMPDRVPSDRECGFCDILECPARIAPRVTVEPSTTTDLF